jgi:hypothetical protein
MAAMIYIAQNAEATQILLTGVHSCLWSWAVSSDQWQRQPKSCLPRPSVAFGLIKQPPTSQKGNMLNISLSWQ